MDKYKNIGSAIRSFCMTAAMLLYLLAVSCSRQEMENPAVAPQGGEALVCLTVSLPRTDLPHGETKAESTDIENYISEIMVLVLEQEEDSYVFRYMAEGELVYSSGSISRFRTLLSSTKKPVKLMVAGNYGDAFSGYAPEAGESEAEIKSSLGCSFPGNDGTLPMYGEVTVPSGLESGKENGFSIKMLRSVARVDITKSLEMDSKPFRIAKAYVYRPNDKVQIAPDGVLSVDHPVVTEPSVFAGAAFSSVPLVKDGTGADPLSVTGLYVPEAEGDQTLRQTGTTCIVVGGYYNDGTALSYYRIDFNPEIEGHPFGQILRNYKYVFNIRKVTAPGWSTPDEAANNRATSIVAEIEAWEDFTTEMYFDGDNHIGLSSRTVSLDYFEGYTGVVDVDATLPYAIQWLNDSGVPVGTAVSGIGESLDENENFSVAVSQDDGDRETVTHLVFTAKAANKSDSDIGATLRLVAGKWTLDVSVIQESPSKYRNRTIRVLSVSEIGDMGSTSPNTASGAALRKILDNPDNFSSSGTVTVGGFSFTEVSQTEVGSSNSANKDIFRSMKGTVNAQDVIYMTYNAQPSADMANVILSWLKGSKNRVLVLGTDTEGSSRELRKIITGNGTWKYNTSGAFRCALQTDGNKRFFTMPFGQVSPSAVISRADATAGFCSMYPSDIVPLVVLGETADFVLGVDIANRIVYHGDANLNQSGSLSSQANSNGTVTSDFDRLTANLWAWIVETVCKD